MRVIAGTNYLQMDGFKERLVVAPSVFSPLPGSGVGRLDLEGDGWGWRAGIAYEIPEYALRASLMYYSQVKLDSVTGQVDLTNLPAALGGLVPGAGTVIPVEGSTAMPEAIGSSCSLASLPIGLPSGSVKWTNWSVLQRIPFYNAGGVEVTALELGYRDGWTVTGGVGHKFNEQWSGAVSLTWDRGTSQGFATLTDTWTVGAGVAYSPNKNVEILFGGRAWHPDQRQFRCRDHRRHCRW
ncbi:outer membrane protein transport protein [Neorhizobium galegae]|nr:outer membrane protein transport protein [Neorhizobium galegae]